MKFLPFLASIALFQSFALLLNANVEFLFDEVAGSTVTSASNSGDTNGSWSSDSPLLIDDGSLNLGYTTNNKSTHVNNNNTTDSFTFDSALASGKHTFEVVISGHDISSAWNNPSGFASFSKEVKFVLVDSLGNGSEIGLRSAWNLAQQTANLNVYSDDSNGNAAISEVELDVSSYPTLIMGVAPVTFQIEVDLDNGGIWTARAKWGADGDWVNLTQNGAGLSDITNINIQTSYSNFSWGSDTTDGVASDYLEIDSISLTELVAQSSADISINGTNWGTNNDANLTGTAISSLIGDSDQINSDPVTLQVAADLNSGDWVSRFKVGSGDWVALVTDGQGMTDFNRFMLNVKTDSAEAWGDSSIVSPNTGDYIKVDSVRVLTGSNFVKSSASFDADYVSPLLAIEFEDAAGTNIAAPNDNTATPDIDESDVTLVATSGSITGTFSNAGHLTDGNGNLNVGYTGENQWVNNFEGSFRTFTFDNTLTSTDTQIAVFEVVISEYDLAKTWDDTNTIGSFDGKGLQVSVQNSSNAGAAINLFTDNGIVPNSVLQLDFDDVAGTNLTDLSVFSALNYTGTWEFGGPQTDGEGNLNIGYSGLNRWSGINGTNNDSSTVYRTFVIDADPNQANNQAIETGRYIFETRIDAADLSGSWKDADHLVSGKGMQIILRKSDNSGAALNFYSHVGNTGYQIKAQSNTWAGAGTTSGSGFQQAFGLSSEGKIDLQIRVNADTGQWTTHAKSTSSDIWKDMELSGTGLTDIASIQIGVKTPINDNGTAEDTTDDTLYFWGDETLDGSSPEEYVDANEDGMFNAGVASQSASSSNLFSDSGDVTYPYAYAVAEPVIVELPQDASMSAGVGSNGSTMEFTWTGSDVNLEFSEDLQTWTSVSNPSNPIVATLSDADAKFYRLTMTASGASSTGEQNIVIDVSNIPEGGANYRIITSDANGGNLAQSDPVALALGENTITVASANAERNVVLWMDADVTFTSLNKNSEAVFTAIPGESYTDTNENGVRDSGNAPLVGDYIKINYLRITQDTSDDSNNSIAVSGKFTGGDTSVLGGTEVSSALESSSSQSGSIQLKIEASMDAEGSWTSAYSTDNGSTWVALVADGTGLQSISNLVFGALNPEYGSWGTVTAGGTASDYAKVNSIILTNSSTQDSLISFNFDETPNGYWLLQNQGSNFQGEAANTGSVSGTWNFGGPRLQSGNLNIGYTEHYKWTAVNDSPYRKYVLEAPITNTPVTLIVDIADYNLSRSWDNDSQYDINSLSNKGVIFRLDANDTDGAAIELVTQNAANDLVLAQDADGDGEPDFADSHPDDPFNGVTPTGVYVNNQFNDADGTQIRDTLDSGSYAPTTDGADAGTLVDSWTGANNDVQVINGALGWGYPGSYIDPDTSANVSANWADANTGSKFRTKVLVSDITSGIAVFETVISGYDLSRSWDSSNTSQFQKGWRMILKNGATSTDRQGAAINLWVTSDDDVMVEGQSWYSADAVVLSTGNVRSKLNDADQADSAGLTLQIVVDTDTGYWYSRYKKNDSSTWNNLTVGSGFTKIDNIQITHKTPSGDAWGDENTSIGDYVLIDSITIKDSSENAVPVPEAPTSLADSDGDGIYDDADQFPTDSANQYDWDNDGVGNGTDSDDEDPTVQ
ncbi:MAG: hypothetical protein P8I61_03240 [Opitutae bacterium]|nr:hypothetical protein [Opitutae bacterium]